MFHALKGCFNFNSETLKLFQLTQFTACSRSSDLSLLMFSLPSSLRTSDFQDFEHRIANHSSGTVQESHLLPLHWMHCKGTTKNAHTQDIWSKSLLLCKKIILCLFLQRNSKVNFKRWHFFAFFFGFWQVLSVWYSIFAANSISCPKWWRLRCCL